MSSQYRGRGKKQNSRGRGGKQNNERSNQPEPTFAPPKNYGSQENIKAAELEQAKIAERLKQNEQLAEAAKSKPPAPRKAEYIEEGKSILSSFFNGFNNLERGNVQVELDHSIGNRLSSFYYESIENHVDSQHLGKDDDEEEKIELLKAEKVRQFNSIVNLSIAIKLGKSGTDLDKKRFKGISVLTSPSPITLPKKLSVIINQLGKTDLPNDNHLRIVEQGLVAKQMLVRGVFKYFKEAKTKSYLITHSDTISKNKYTWKNLMDLVNEDRNLRVMIDDHSTSVDFLQNYSKFRFSEFRKNKNFLVKFNELEITVSLPYFDFEKATEDSIVKYLSNPLFTGTFQDGKLVSQIVAIIVTPLLEVNHIRKPNQKLGDLFNAFKKSYLKDVTIQDLFDVLHVWNINRFISDNDLDDLATYVYESYQTGGRNYFSKFLDCNEINFTNFGTDAQLVEIDKEFVTQDNDKFKKRERSNFGIALNRIKGKAKALTKFKISETGAIFGSSVKFNNGVKFTSDYEVQFTGKNKDILSEFIKKDFLK